jgi:hypothetical protein
MTACSFRDACAVSRRALALAGAAALACSSSDGDRGATVDFSGDWEGLASVGSGASRTYLALTHRGATVTGTLGAFPGTNGAALIGNVDGATLSFTLDFGGLCAERAVGSGTVTQLSDRDHLQLHFQGASSCSGSIAGWGSFDRMRCPGSTTACPAVGASDVAYCADLWTDSANCGTCWNRCHDLQVCAGGSCQVPACAGPVPLEAPRPILAGVSAVPLALADLDGNGTTDVLGSTCIDAAGEACRVALEVLRNDGAATFSAPVTTVLLSIFPSDPAPPIPGVTPPPVPYFPSAIAVGDLDRDGRADLAAYVGALEYPWTRGSEGEVLTLLGNGDGSFRAGERMSTGADEENLYLGPRLLALADLDGDGILDLAARSGATPFVQVRLGVGDGTLAPKREYALADPVRALAIADLDGDGVLDLAVASDGWRTGGPSYRVVSVLLGTGDGTLRAPIESPGVQFPVDLVVADVDEDGIPDLVIAGWWSSAPHDVPDVSVLLGNGDGTFRAPLAVEAESWSFTRSLAIADLDRDGHLDLAAGDEDRGLELFLGRGDGTFAPFEQPIRGGAGRVLAADLDHDGRIDLVTGGPRVLRACGP